MRLLVCGGRDVGRVPSSSKMEPYNLANALSEASAAQIKIYDIMDDLQAGFNFETLITESGPGAAQVVRDWASHRGLASEVMRARRLLFFKESQDSVRQRLFSEGKPDLVVCLVADEWCEDIVETARSNGIRLIEYSSLDEPGLDNG